LHAGPSSALPPKDSARCRSHRFTSKCRRCRPTRWRRGRRARAATRCVHA
jgi:hypothetical protein